jgi:putative redox protein
VLRSGGLQSAIGVLQLALDHHWYQVVHAAHRAVIHVTFPHCSAALQFHLASFYSGGFMPTANVKWTGGEEFTSVMPSGHSVKFDGDRKHNAAPSPMEMLLSALGACSLVDVVLILEKKRQKLTSLEVDVTGERAETTPAVWKKIEMVYRLAGELDDKAVRDSIELSQNKYCSVAAMLGKTAEITYRYEIAAEVTP